MEELKRFIKQNPLLAAGIFLVLMLGIYFAFSTLYSGYKIAKLERENVRLQEEGDKLKSDLGTMQDAFKTSQGVIQEKETELKKKDELLQVFTQQVADNKVALNNATTTYNNLRNDSSPMSSTELHSTLCGLYPDRCK
jgi:regulator of replication initiation timing